MNVHAQTDSEADTRALAARLAGRLRGGDCVALDGPLGCGKTCFVRGLAEGLGLDPAAVSSPTFVIHHEYAGGGPLVLAHLDAYRLSGPDELETIGWDDVLSDPETIVAVEWACRIEAALPPNRISVVLEHLAEHTRAITLGAPDGLAGRLEGLTEWRRPPTRCPTCGGDVEPAAAAAPFCSPRCRLVDLGRWMNEEYRIEP
ncbi:MAG: tRNA (adenosine(37)-N6)-threonylcarbamoyltransferase complex ATPase subunit type 1 TsaE [Planctomycetes bacterium]|nr:tRNA (adenosine(37)-N6)-threonylcarbamoyltransferase complex ATPase subunit type 1 TsaE [Planctomycetota bacterium]